MSRVKNGMISPMMKQAEYPIGILCRLFSMSLKNTKKIRDVFKNNRFFHHRMIGYPETARFQ